MAGCIQEAFRGVLKCLGLDGGEVVVNNPPPPLDPASYEPLLAATDDTSKIDPLSSPIDSTAITTNGDNNLETESNFNLVTIDEIISTSGGTTAEAHYVQLLVDGQPNMNLLATSLISSGGGGKTH